VRPCPFDGTGSNVPARLGRGRFGVVALLVAALGAGAFACSADPAELPDLTGEAVEVVAVWQDAEAAAFEAVLERFSAETGATVTYTSTAGEDVQAVLDRRLAAGDPPTVAVLPQRGLLERYAARGEIVPLGPIVGEQVEASWPSVWRELGEVDGELYGLWFKAANKSLVWYSLRRFEEAGVIPPDDLDGLQRVVDGFARDGTASFALPGAPADAWTVTDWFENLYLRLAGPERYDALAERRLPWTDESVRRTLEVLAALLTPAAVHTAPDLTFPGAVAAVFAPRPLAAMVMEGDFVPGVAPPGAAEVGIDVDVFDFPGTDAAERFVVGGGDAAVLMRPTEAGEALVRYLATTDAAEVWARRGGFLSPNEDVDLRAYPDATTRRIARSLLQSGDRFRFDLSDLQPVAFGGTTGAGMWAELTRFLEDPSDVEGTMARLEAAATAAWDDG
jgi:alpha-glucoside transport system substrate-binding protein